MIINLIIINIIIYYPCRYIISKQKFDTFFINMNNRFLIDDDFNAKNDFWGLRILNPRDRILLYK